MTIGGMRVRRVNIVRSGGHYDLGYSMMVDEFS
jgi:hypothetical protein